MTDKARWTRRTFLGKAAAFSAAGVAFPTIIPRSALAQGDRPGANDRIGVAGIGVGRQGNGVFRSAAGHRLAQTVCVCDVSQPRAESVARSCGAEDAVPFATVRAPRPSRLVVIPALQRW